MHLRFLSRILSLALLAAALFAFAPMARANQDNVQFFSDIRIPDGETAHDTVCFFCSVHADGEINGDVVVFFGNVDIAKAAHHDVVNFFGSVTASDNATIGGSVVNFFGSLRLGADASVDKDVVSMFGGTHIAPTATIHGSRVNFPFWIFGIPMLIVIAIVVSIVREIRARHYRAYMANYPYPPRV